jgi:predicted TIM-barrel fold metal-dependent hydrolase
MIIDFHAHIFPKTIRDNREQYFKGEPAFELLYAPPKSRMAGATDIISAMDEDGVDVSVVFGFPWRDADTFRKHNDYIMEAVQRYPSRLIGFCCFDAASPSAADETGRCLEGGLSGVGELAFYKSGIDEDAVERLRPVMALCAEKNVPVLIHTNEPVGHVYPGKTPITLGQIYRMVAAFQENLIVLAHWGGGVFFFNLLKREAKDILKNVYFDTAASPFLYDPDIYRIAADLAGPDKILFGSDFPLIKPARYFMEMGAAGLSEEVKKGICGGNAARLLKMATDE